MKRQKTMWIKKEEKRHMTKKTVELYTYMRITGKPRRC
jgi:hypothetical protein